MCSCNYCTYRQDGNKTKEINFKSHNNHRSNLTFYFCICWYYTSFNPQYFHIQFYDCRWCSAFLGFNGVTHTWRMEIWKSELQDESGIVPLAFPLLAGPGALTTVMLSFETYGPLVTGLSIIIVSGITYAILRSVEPIYRFLGKRGSMIVTRIFAIIIAAFAVQFVIDGIKQIFSLN